MKDTEDMLTLKLAPEEHSYCKVQDYLQPYFDLSKEKTMPFSLSSEQGIADMVEIDELNHATLLHNLFKRYTKDEIYTYVGPILLAMNPFKSVDYLYTEEEV